MRPTGSVTVAVVTARPDLDLAISLWLPGYQARAAHDPESLIGIVRGGGVGLLDLTPARCEPWLSALRRRGFDGPLVVMGSGEGTTIDLDRRVVVAPLRLPDLAAAFELARQPEVLRDLSVTSPVPPPPPVASPVTSRVPSRAESADLPTARSVPADDSWDKESLFGGRLDPWSPPPAPERGRRQPQGRNARRERRLPPLI